jgi:hypothetical protein
VCALEAKTILGGDERPKKPPLFTGIRLAFHVGVGKRYRKRSVFLLKETLNKDEFRNFGGYWFLMTLQRPEKLCFAA